LLGESIAWDVGKRYVDLYQTGSTTKVASVLLTVCEHNADTCS
jgi:hypothetical protein